MLNGLSPNSLAIAAEPFTLRRRLDTASREHGYPKPYGAHWLLGRTTIWPGNTSDRYRDRHASRTPRALGHLQRCLLAYRSMLTQNSRGDTKIPLLCRVRVRHKTAVEPCGAAGDIRQHLRHPAAGARLRGSGRLACGFERAPDTHR